MKTKKSKPRQRRYGLTTNKQIAVHYLAMSFALIAKSKQNNPLRR